MGRTIATVAIALAVLLTGATAPAMAATPDDDGIIGTDDEGINVGGDEGVSVGTDGVSVGGDEGVDVDSEGVSIGGDDGVTAGTDGVQVGDAGTGDVGSGSLPIGGEDVPVGGGSVDLPTRDDAPALPTNPGQLVSPPDEGAPSLPSPEGASLAVPAQKYSLEQAPVDVAAPGIPGAPSPDVIPVGPKDRFSCNLPVGADDVPTESIPGPGALPVKPPGVPVELVTPGLVVSMAFGVAPSGCTVLNPQDPAVNPVDGTDPSAQKEFRQGSVGTNTALRGSSSGQLDEGEAGWSETGAIIVSPEYAGGMYQFTTTDGRTEDYLGGGGVIAVDRADRTVSTSADVSAFGSGAGAGVTCAVPSSGSTPSLGSDITGPCTYTTDGVPALVGPETVTRYLKNPPVGGGSLPVGGGGSPVGSLPANAQSLLNL